MEILGSSFRVQNTVSFEIFMYLFWFMNCMKNDVKMWFNVNIIDKSTRDCHVATFTHQLGEGFFGSFSHKSNKMRLIWLMWVHEQEQNKTYFSPLSFIFLPNKKIKMLKSLPPKRLKSFIFWYIIVNMTKFYWASCH